MFLAGFAEADIVGTCEKLDDPQAPVWTKVHVTNVEALGCGTIPRDDADGFSRMFTSPSGSRNTQPSHMRVTCCRPGSSSSPRCSSSRSSRPE
jgi:hypothetical protein